MASCTIVDLSQPLRTGQPVYPGDPGVRFSPRATHEKEGYAVTEIHMGSHDGTHMDAGYHFFPDRPTLDGYPPDRFIGKGVIIDLRDSPADTAVPADTFATALAAAGGVGPGDFAILWFGWDAHYGKELMWRNPYLSPEDAQTLVEAGVTLVGTDAGNVDSSSNMGAFPVHQTLLGRDILIVENLCHLERLGSGRVTCAFLPLPLAGDGAPVRAVAWRE